MPTVKKRSQISCKLLYLLSFFDISCGGILNIGKIWRFLSKRRIQTEREMQGDRNMKQRIIGFLLAVLMAATMLPVQALAEEIDAAEPPAEEREETLAAEEAPVAEETPLLTAETGTGAVYTGKLGENVTWSLDTATGALTVSGSGAMTNYSSESSPLWNYRGYIKSAVIEAGVTSVGNYAFRGCTNLTAITLPDGITRIGNGAFSGCSALTAVTIPDSVTSIDYGAFWGCSALTAVTIPDSVTSIGGHAFYDCGALTSVTMGSSVAYIDDYAFWICNSLQKVTISDIAAWFQISFGNDSSNPVSYAHALYLGDELLTDLVIPGTVTAIGQYALYGCTSITSVYIPTSVTSIGQSAFNGMSSLSSVRYAGSQDDWLKINIGSYNEPLTNLTPQYNQSIGDYCRVTAAAGDHGTVAFDNTLVKKGDTVTIRALPDPGYAVESYLVDGAVISGNTFTASGDHVVSATFTKVYDVADNGNAHGSCGTNVKWALDTRGTLHIYGSGAMADYNNSPFKSYRDSITSAVIADGITTIGKSAFDECRKLAAVVIPVSVTSIGDYAFQDCSALADIVIPSSVTSIGDGAFRYCPRLSSVEFLGDAPTSFGWGVFSGSGSFFAIFYHSGTTGWTSPQWEGYNAVCCDDVVTDFSTLDDSGRNAQGIYFQLNTTAMTAIVGVGTTADNNAGYRGGQNGVVRIPDTVTRDGVSYRVIGIGQYAFANCPWVNRVELGQNLSSVLPSAFQGCKNLTAITVAASNLQFADRDGVLYDKGGLYLYVYPSGKTDVEYDIPASCTTIGAKAFYGAVNLKAIAVPATVTDIGAQAFSGCNNLEEITLPFIGGNAESGKQFNYVFGSDSWSSYGGVPQSLKTVTILTANLGNSAFYNCSAIETLYLLDCSELTWIPEECFSECTSLKKLVFGGGKSTPYSGVYIPNTVSQIGYEAFFGCASLTSITLGRNVSNIDREAFRDCKGITQYAVAAKNRYFAADKWGVLYDKDMTTLRYYPSGRAWPYYNVAKTATTIGESAFSSCDTLVNLFIPNSVTTFGEGWGYYCISGCPNMTVCCYQGSAAARYAVSNNLTAWYMDNYTMQGITVKGLPEYTVVSTQGQVLSCSAYVTAQYGDKTLQLDEYTVQPVEGYGAQTPVTFCSGNVSTTVTTNVVRQGNVNGSGTAQGDIDASDVQCLYELLTTGQCQSQIKNTDTLKLVADINNDGAVDVYDLQRLYEAVSGINPF